MFYKCIGFNINVMWQSTCLVINPITQYFNFTVLFKLTPVNGQPPLVIGSFSRGKAELP